MKLGDLEFPEDESTDESTVEIIDPATADMLEDETGENALQSLIPLLSGNPRKSEYLKWRILGFQVKESCRLTNVTLDAVQHWRRIDEDFAEFERTKIPEYRKSAMKELQLLSFSRNMALIMHIDQKVLLKAAATLRSLHAIEYDWLKSAQARYQPRNLIDLERSLGPEVANETNINGQNIIVYMDGRQVDTEAAKRAGARELLSQFKVNRQIAESDEDASYPAD